MLCWGWRTLIPLQHRASSGRPAEAELNALTTGIAEGMVTKHLMNELWCSVRLVTHVDSTSSKAWPSRRGLGRMKNIDLKYMRVLDDAGKDQTDRSGHINTKPNKTDLMTKCHGYEPRLRSCAMLEDSQRRTLSRNVGSRVSNADGT